MEVRNSLLSFNPERDYRFCILCPEAYGSNFRTAVMYSAQERPPSGVKPSLLPWKRADSTYCLKTCVKSCA